MNCSVLTSPTECKAAAPNGREANQTTHNIACARAPIHEPAITRGPIYERQELGCVLICIISDGTGPVAAPQTCGRATLQQFSACRMARDLFLSFNLSLVICRHPGTGRYLCVKERKKLGECYRHGCQDTSLFAVRRQSGTPSFAAQATHYICRLVDRCRRRRRRGVVRRRSPQRVC